MGHYGREISIYLTVFNFVANFIFFYRLGALLLARGDQVELSFGVYLNICRTLLLGQELVFSEQVVFFDKLIGVAVHVTIFLSVYFEINT